MARLSAAPRPCHHHRFPIRAFRRPPPSGTPPGLEQISQPQTTLMNWRCAQIALGELLLYLAVVLQRLTQHEEQFRAVIARQRRFDLGSAFLDSIMCQRGQLSWIAFTG